MEETLNASQAELFVLAVKIDIDSLILPASILESLAGHFTRRLRLRRYVASHRTQTYRSCGLLRIDGEIVTMLST